MAVRIRLTRVGATKRPSYRVVAIDRRRARDGRALEILGFYDPLTEPATVRLETDKIKAWIGRGAQPSETVVKLMRQAEAGASGGAAAGRSAPAKRTTRARKPKTSPAPADRAAAEAAKETTPAAEAAAEEPQAPAADAEPAADEKAKA